MPRINPILPFLFGATLVSSGSDNRVGPFLYLYVDSAGGDFEITADQESSQDFLCVPVFTFGETVSRFEIEDASKKTVVSARCGDGFAITGLKPDDSGCFATMRATGDVEEDTGREEDAGADDTSSAAGDTELESSNLCTCEISSDWNAFGEECAGSYRAVAVSVEGETATLSYHFKWTPSYSRKPFGCK